jgi:Uma2 family endonuclease
MTIAKEPDSAIGIFEDIVLPTEEIYSDEPPLETDLHLNQIFLLLNSLGLLWKHRNDFYAAGNLSIYYDPAALTLPINGTRTERKKLKKFRGPDVFVVLDTERRDRKSWVVWQENYKYPNVIVEVLSPKTARVDKTTKKMLYQNTFRTPEYFWFGPFNLEFAGFRLENGEYQPIEPNAQGHLWSQELGLYLGLHERKFIRFFTPAGELVPTGDEKSELEAILRKQAEQQTAQETILREQAEQQTAIAQEQTAQETILREQAQEQAAKFAAKLRELNIDVDSLLTPDS